MTGPELMAYSTRRVNALQQRRDRVTLYARSIALVSALAGLLFLAASAGVFWASLDVYSRLTTGDTLTKERVLTRMQSYLRVYGVKR